MESETSRAGHRRRTLQAKLQVDKKLDTNLPLKFFKNQKGWEAWLGRHFDSSAGLWPRNILIVSLLIIMAGLALIMRAAVVSIEERLKALEEHEHNEH